MNKRRILTTRVLPIAGALIILGVTGWAVQENHGAKAAPKVQIAVNTAPLQRDGKFTTSFAQVVQRVEPCVVNISSTKKAKASLDKEFQPFFDDPMFRKFFGDEFGKNGSRHHHRQTFKESSLGSGVIVSKDGYILTNNHVVDGAQDIKVTLKGQETEYLAKVVGHDPKTDVAVVKIDAKDLPFVTFADSSKVEVGDVVLALGNPFGVGQTVTMGIVSAVGRGGMGIEDYEDFIQTDAAINPGNSGGALVDADGRLIGINTAILSHSGGFQGVGFAVPANLARNVMDQLIAKGHVDRGYLGVMIQNVTPDLAKAFKDAKTGGALVSEVTPKSSAAEAGLKDGDIITEFNGKAVRDSRSLQFMVAETAPGSKVPMKVLRDGKEMALNITVREMPSKKLASNESKSSTEKYTDVLDGVTVSDMDAASRDAYDLPRHLKGAVVTDIDPGSAAYQAGLREGDVIQEIGHKPVTSADQAEAAGDHTKGKHVLLRVWSKGGSHYLVVDETKAG